MGAVVLRSLSLKLYSFAQNQDIFPGKWTSGVSQPWRWPCLLWLSNFSTICFSKYVSIEHQNVLLRVMDQEYFVNYQWQCSLEKCEIPGQTYPAEYRSQILTSTCNLSNRRRWGLEGQEGAVKKSASPLAVLSSRLSFPSFPCPHKCLKTKPSGKIKFFCTSSLSCLS